MHKTSIHYPHKEIRIQTPREDMYGSRTNRWSLPGAGCGLTDVDAGEEQARKVIVGYASRCGEDK
jgi:hypothetical protein